MRMLQQTQRRRPDREEPDPEPEETTQLLQKLSRHSEQIFWKMMKENKKSGGEHSTVVSVCTSGPSCQGFDSWHS